MDDAAAPDSVRTEQGLPQRRLLPLPEGHQEPIPHFAGKTVSAGPHQLFVRRTPQQAADPDAEPALYVHGLGGSATNWTDLMHSLSRRLRGTAVDLPGFGYSPPPEDGEFGLPLFVDALTQLIEAEGDAVHLFGNSMGGAVVTSLASRRPDLVRTVTLVAPALPTYRALSGHVMLFSGLLEPLRQRFSRGRAPQIEASPEAFADMLTELVFADPGRLHPTRRAEMAAEIRRRTPLPYVRDAFSQSLRSLLQGYVPGSGNLWRAARQITAPTLAVLGSEDRLVDVGVAGRIARHVRHSRVVIESDLGHVPQIERPYAVAAVVADRLDELAEVPARQSLTGDDT